ncbi:MAG TPA: DNA polymerase domain-containing protein [Thermoplasmata archaeon]|nr:DNA polymerase domain-containing protein [Thermoplasmata archaeon]
MEPFELFLLEGSYQAVDDGVVVELFGRTRSGEAIVARYYGFRPYFVITEPTDEVRDRLRKDPEIVEVTDLTTWAGGKDRPAIRVTLHRPWLVPQYRDQFRRHGEEWSVLACDIPFVHRFLYDKGLGLTVAFDGEDEPPEIRARYTVPRVVRVVTEGGRDVRPSEPFRPAWRILSFDIENSIRNRTIFTICGVAEGGGRARRTFRLGGPDERAILEGFAREVAEDDPDVVTGYNIGGYDLPLLVERAKAVGLAVLPLGRERSEPREMGDRLWKVAGRVIADAWWSARRELHPKQETLQYVARTLLGDTKLDVDRRNMDAEWANDPERVMEYCEHDADLALRILVRLRAMEKAADLATVARLPLEEGLNGRTSLFIDAMLIPRADREGVGVLPSHRATRDAPIEGGYVHAIRPGLYRWVVVLDFKSMYPSIIISRNLCFTTLSPEGTTIAPSGARFLSPDVRRGLIPAILADLMADRARFRAESRAAETAELRAYYDGLQNAVKVLMNSFYGVLASSFYRFTNKEIGAAITAFAREAITSIIRALEADGHEVVYSDTDSVFVRSPVDTLDGARAFGEGIAKRFTHEGATFEFQSVYESFFSHGAKKRYVGRTVWPQDEVVVRGYETRRTDAFDYQSEALLEVFDLVLKGDTDGAVRRSRELVQAVRAKKVPVERLVIARAVRAESEYNESTRDNLPFLRVFRRLREEGYDVIPGMKVAWVVTDSTQSPQAIEPWIEGRAFPAEPDWEYYADRVAQTLARVTEVFDWDAAALLRGSHQQRLGGDGSDARPAAAPTNGTPAGLDTPVAEIAKPAKRRTTTRSLAEFP